MTAAGVSAKAVERASAWLVAHGFVARVRRRPAHSDWVLMILPTGGYQDVVVPPERDGARTSVSVPAGARTPVSAQHGHQRPRSTDTCGGQLGDRRRQEGTEGASTRAEPTEPAAIDPPPLPAHRNREPDSDPDPSHWAEAIGERLREYAGTKDEPARSMVLGCGLNLRDPQARTNFARAIDDCGGGWQGCEQVADVLALRWDAVAKGELEPKLAACTFGGDGKAWDVARERWGQHQAAEQVRLRAKQERHRGPDLAPLTHEQAEASRAAADEALAQLSLGRKSP